MVLKSDKTNANYDFEKKDVRPKTWGQNDFANMPSKPMHLGFSGKQDYRDGIVNGFTCEVSEMSGIEENGKLW